MPSFADHFRKLSERTVGGGAKTTGATETVWRGVVDMVQMTIRVTVRCIVQGESFLTCSNHRLTDSNVGRGGHFLDVVFVQGDLDGPRRLKLAAWIMEVDTRPLRFRRTGETLPRGGTASVMDGLIFNPQWNGE